MITENKLIELLYSYIKCVIIFGTKKCIATCLLNRKFSRVIASYMHAYVATCSKVYSRAMVIAYLVAIWPYSICENLVA